MAKGDTVTVTTKSGIGDFVVEAQQLGRKIGYAWEKQGTNHWLVVREVTRGGTTVREMIFALDEVVSIDMKAKEMG
jgi:hypothetical protein